jgi:hypothetical protein
MAEDRWRVMRQDDNGNVYVVAGPLPFLAAQAMAEEYTRRAHKQLYWIEPVEPEP